MTPDVAVVTPLNNPGGPEGDTVTVDEQLLNTEYWPRQPPRPPLQDWNGRQAVSDMAKYERKRSARLSTPRHPITMASTAEPPDPMPCALAAILLPESCVRSCRMQKGLFPGT